MTDFAPGLETAFAAPPVEFAPTPAVVHGTLPAWLRGSLYLVGPARFERGGQRYGHWLDGDGMVVALHFDEEGATAAARYVRTEKWIEEEESGQAIYRTFGTAFPGSQLRRGRALASPANVSVHPFAGRLLVFGEQGLPYELDEYDLTTIGRYGFGSLNEVTPFSAHPALDPATGELTNFGLSFAADRPSLQLFQFDVDGTLSARSRVELELPYSLHDFSLSGRFAVFHLAPYLLDVAPMLTSGATVADSLVWRPEIGSQLLVVERAAGQVAARIAIGGGYCLHQVNAFDDGDELVVDFLELDEPVYPDYDGLPELFLEVRPAHVVRLRVDPIAGRLLERQVTSPGFAADFPVLDPHLAGLRAEEFWMLAIAATGQSGRKFFDRLQRFDWRVGEIVDTYATAPPLYLAGEPVYVPEFSGGRAVGGGAGGAEARSGVILCHELDVAARESAFVVLDAFDLARGPLARIVLPSPVHLGFHAAFRASEGGR